MMDRPIESLQTCLVINLVLSAPLQEDPLITASKKSDSSVLTCQNSKWSSNSSTTELEILDYENFLHQDKCGSEGSFVEIVIKVRPCDNCIELNPVTITAIAAGNILATILIGVAVYSLTAQPKTKSFSGNKASDKVNLLHNGEGDTYQQLNQGQKSEYQVLGHRKK
ncbi:hypothetical protein NFI96_012941 [Prochilodus magdalenae]|nr:hypothetical protein NFI96_012941 [Prochilodus magdalenae]